MPRTSITVARSGPAENAGSLPIRLRIRGARLPRMTEVSTMAAVVSPMTKLPIIL